MSNTQAESPAIRAAQDYQKIGEFLTIFSKGLKTSLIYPPGNSIPREFKRSCWQKLKDYLEQFGRMNLDVHPDSFKDLQHLIFKSPGREENLPGYLYRDGIRRLCFKAGLTQDEWDGFFDDLLTVIKNRDGFEDLVNLFWQRDFLHIEYDAVDEFSLAEYSDAKILKKDQETVVYSDVVLVELQAETVNPLEILNPGHETEAAEVSLTGVTEEIGRIFDNLQKFSDDERTYIEKQVEIDNELIIEFEAIDLLLEILVSEKEMSSFDDSINAVNRMFDRILEAEQFPLLVYLIRALKNSQGMFPDNSAVRAEKFKDCLSRTGDRIRITKITNLLNRSENGDLDGVRIYLEELDWDCLTSLIWMLGELNFFPARKMIIQLLVNKGRERIDIIGNAVFDARWYVVRNAVLILGKIGGEKVLPYLKKPLEHSDDRVRWEAVAAVEKIATPEGLSCLLPRLYDEASRVRRKVISLLSAHGYEPAYFDLEKIVVSPDFDNLELDERKEYLLALALTGGQKAVPLLKKMILKWSLFAPEIAKKQKELAIVALASIVSEEAESILHGVARKKDELGALARMILEKKRGKQPDSTGGPK